MRIIIATIFEGHPIDIGCFKAWADAASNNLPGFYNSDMFVDYPPVYIYVLFIMAKIAKISGFFSITWAYTLIIKLPSILSDIFLSYLIYKITRNRISEKSALVCATLYLFNPTVILNSTVWGQVDSLFTLIIAGALILLSMGKFSWSGAAYSIAILMKPQGIIFLPVLFFHLLKEKKIINFVNTGLSALITSIIILVPFSFNQSPLWIFKLFVNTASSYKGASVNAFNLFALLGANWKDDSSILFLFSYKTWGFIFIVVVTLFTLFLYIKGSKDALPLISSLILITGVFVLSSKMHERYLYPSMALCLLSYAFLKDNRFLLLFTGFSLTGFINTYNVFVLSLNEVYWIAANDSTLKYISLINILLFIYLIYISSDIVVRGHTSFLNNNKLLS